MRAGRQNECVCGKGMYNYELFKCMRDAGFELGLIKFEETTGKARTSASVREDHQPWVEDNRYQYMTSNNKRNWDYQCPIPSWDLPFKRHDFGREDDHHRNTHKADRESKFEALPNSGYFNPERRKFDFFSSGTPCHIIGEQMGEESGR